MANSHGRIFVPVQLSQVSRIFSLPLAYTEQAAPKAAKTAARPRKGRCLLSKRSFIWMSFLLVNFLVAYFLLQAAGLLSSQHAAFSRMVCASGIASLSALILFAPELSYPAQILYKILTACAVVGVAFGLQGCGTLSPPCAGMPRSTFCWPGFASPLSCAQAHRCCKRQILRYTCAFRRSCCCCFPQPAAARCGWYCTFRAARRRPPGRLGSSLNCAVPRAAARHTGYWVPPERPRHLPAGAAHQLAGGKRPTAGESTPFGAVVPGPAPQYAAGRCQSAGDTLQYRCAARAAAGVCGGGYQHHHRNGDAKPWLHRRCFCPQPFQSGEYEALYGSDFCNHAAGLYQLLPAILFIAKHMINHTLYSLNIYLVK